MSESLRSDSDLLRGGLVDSLGIIEIISEIENHFGISIDFEDLPAEEFTVVGPFCRYVSEKATALHQ